MSLVHLSNLTAHIKNCSRLNLATTSVPYSKFHLQLCFLLYKQGFVSSIARGSTSGPDKQQVDVTPDNIATRRLWLGLKYRNNSPVIRNFELISKPSRRVNFEPLEIKALASGIPVKIVEPLQPAECIFIKTHNGEVLEVQDAAKMNLGGTVLCRIR